MDHKLVNCKSEANSSTQMFLKVRVSGTDHPNFASKQLHGADASGLIRGPSFISLPTTGNQCKIESELENKEDTNVSNELAEKPMHKGPKQAAPIFECDIFGCNQTFKTKYSLKRHYNKHYSKKELKCRFCPKKFCLPQYRKDHEYTHTGEKPYVCNLCPMRFR